ncbi:CidA/LrgA family protein [Shigella flexneri]
MVKTLNIIWQSLRAFVLIYAYLYAGIFIASLLPVTIPGSVVGMLILLSCWPCKFFRQMGRSGVYVLIRYMALLFVPIGVGVMRSVDLLRAQFGRSWFPVQSVRWWFFWWWAGVHNWYTVNVKS